MNIIKAIGKKIEESPFFTFSEKPLDFFEKDKLFKIIFMVIFIGMAVITLLHPLRILFRMITSGYFNYGMRFGIKYVIAFSFIWLSIAIACWLGFHLWWNRRKKATALFGSSEFVVLPFFAEIIRTFGEWLGIMYAVIGFIGGLFGLIFLRGNSGRVISAILSIGGDNRSGIGETIEGIPLIGGGLVGFFDNLLSSILNFAVILGPVAGVVIILLTRFISERLRVFAAIANNTKKSTVLAAIANNAQKASVNKNVAVGRTTAPKKV